MYQNSSEAVFSLNSMRKRTSLKFCDLGQLPVFGSLTCKVGWQIMPHLSEKIEITAEEPERPAGFTHLLMVGMLQENGVQEDSHVPISSSLVKLLGFAQERMQELATVKGKQIYLRGTFYRAGCEPSEKALIQRVVSLVLFLYHFTCVFMAALSLHCCTDFL